MAYRMCFIVFLLSRAFVEEKILYTKSKNRCANTKSVSHCNVMYVSYTAEHIKKLHM